MSSTQACGDFQARAAQQPRSPLIVAVEPLAIDEEGDALLEGQCVDGGGLLLLLEGFDHAVQLQGSCRVSMVGFVNMVCLRVVWIVSGSTGPRTLPCAGSSSSSGSVVSSGADPGRSPGSTCTLLRVGLPRCTASALAASRRASPYCAAEVQEPQAGSIALLGMGLGAQQMLDHGAGVRADRGAPVDQPRRRPLGVRAVRFRHVLRQASCARRADRSARGWRRARCGRTPRRWPR